MAKEWHISRNNRRVGPFTAEDIVAMAKSGKLHPSDLVQKEGMTEWTPASQIKGLFTGETPHSSKVESGSTESVSNSESTDDIRQQLASAAADVGRSVKATVAIGTDRLRRSFGASMKSAVSDAGTALRILLGHPIRLLFLTVVFWIACLLSTLGIITAVLIPALVIGYITVLGQVIKGDEPSLSSMISFLRHGWDSMWHLLMMFAAFIVTFAAFITPVLLIVGTIYVAGGTVTAVFAQISDLSNNPSNQVDLGGSRSPWTISDNTGSPFTGWLDKIGSGVTKMIFFILQFILTTLICTAIAIPWLMIFVLGYDVGTTKRQRDQQFDLVFDAFGRMLLIGRLQWKRLLCSGLLIGCIQATATTFIGLAFGLLMRARLFPLSGWVMGIAYPTWTIVFGVFANLFLVAIAISMVRQVRDLDRQKAG